MFYTYLSDTIFNLNFYLSDVVFFKHNSGRTTEDRHWLNGYIQEEDVAEESFIPDFNGEGV